MAPNDAKKPSNELDACINVKLRYAHTRTYPYIKVGNNLYIYTKLEKGYYRMFVGPSCELV